MAENPAAEASRSGQQQGRSAAAATVADPSEISLEANLLQEMIEHGAPKVDRSQEINEHRADSVINGCNIPMKLRPFLDDLGHPIKEERKKPQQVTCPKVPQLLRKRERSKDYFDPKVVSFGPYHHGKPELQEAETLKTEVMLQFINESGKSFVEFYSKVCDMNAKNRACYVDGSTDEYCDDMFALMMLQDGCFILYVMDILVNQKWNTNIILPCVGVLGFEYLIKDFFLLENQIPFAVLKLLMSLRNDKKIGMRMIKPLVHLITWGILPRENTGEEPSEEPSVHHLLQCIQKEFSKYDNQNEELALCSKIYKATQIDIEQLDVTDYVPSFRSVSELKAKGIHCKPINSSSPHLVRKRIPNYLRNVKFIPGFFHAELMLPALLFDVGDIAFYNNLIAFELCPSTDIMDAVATSYICFLNTLINNPDDVKELRSKRILLNSTGSDKEVYKAFKEIATFSMQNVLLYQGVREVIEKHYNSKTKTWAAEIIFKYFGSPWTSLGLLATIAVLVLSFLQTYYTMHPVKEK